MSTGLGYMKYVTNNKNEIKKYDMVYCLYCKEEIKSKAIPYYIMENDGEETAICPYCNVDAIIPNYKEFTQEQLNQWHKDGFETVVEFK